MSTSKDLTIFISSTDSYSDCWEPFFKLWSAYWPDCPHRIILNTETKRYERGVPNVESTCIATDGKRPPWGTCTRLALSRLDSPYVLWLQEDYFLKAAVNGTAIMELIDLMAREKILHLNLVQNPESIPWPGHTNLRVVGRRARYRASLQAGLWDRAHLLSLIRNHESPWMFERYGSIRARRATKDYLCVGGAWREDGPGMIFPYDLTGIVQGRWERKVVVDLFTRHGLNVDFTRRGFTDEPARPRKKASFLRRAWDHGRSMWHTHIA